MTEFKEVQLVEQKDLREQCINRIEVLDKVKKIFLIPEMKVMTTKMVAEYYEVGYEAIKTCYKVNKDEINLDGVIVKPYKDFSTVLGKPLKTEKGKATFKVSESIIIEIPTRGINVFPQRAILRIGMLLRDSLIAKEVRTQLLNVFEHSTDKQKTANITEEESLYNEIGRTYMMGDLEGYSIATKKAMDFKNRYIKKIENTNVELVQANEVLHSDNKALAGDILEWSDRACLNKAVRTLASKVHKPFGYIFKELYDELRYKQNIGLSQRGNPPYIQHIKENEWNQVMQSFSAICENNDCSATQIIQKARTDHKSIKN